MLRLASDENFNNRIVRALLRKIKDLDLIRIQDTPLFRGDDPAILDWAAQEGRVLLTHDFATLIGYAYERVAAGQPMPGVFAARTGQPIGLIVEDLELLVLAAEPREFEQQVIYLPL